MGLFNLVVLSVEYILLPEVPNSQRDSATGRTSFNLGCSEQGLYIFSRGGGDQGEKGRGALVTVIYGSCKQCGYSFSSCDCAQNVVSIRQGFASFSLWWPGAALTNEGLKQILSLFSQQRRISSNSLNYLLWKKSHTERKRQSLQNQANL